MLGDLLGVLKTGLQRFAKLWSYNSGECAKPVHGDVEHSSASFSAFEC